MSVSKKFFVTIVMNHLCKILLSNWRVDGLGVLSDVFSECIYVCMISVKSQIEQNQKSENVSFYNNAYPQLHT